MVCEEAVVAVGVRKIASDRSSGITILPAWELIGAGALSSIIHQDETGGILTICPEESPIKKSEIVS